jgi:hypothetical protein
MATPFVDDLLSFVEAVYPALTCEIRLSDAAGSG